MRAPKDRNIAHDGSEHGISRLSFTSPVSRGLAPIAVLLLWVVAAARIVWTYHMLNQNWNEGAHVVPENAGNQPPRTTCQTLVHGVVRG